MKPKIVGIAEDNDAQLLIASGHFQEPWCALEITSKLISSNLNKSKKSREGWDFPWAGRAAPRDFPRENP